MGLAQYLYAARKLNNIGRWASEFMHIRSSVSEHSFFVTQIAQMLGVIEEEKGRNIDWEKLYKKALNHDVVEAFTGDILSNVKNMTPKIKHAVDDVENMIAEELLFSKIDSPYKEIYRDMIFDGKDESIEGQILRYADNIDAMLECLTEAKLGNNTPFKKKYEEIKVKLQKVELQSVKYFITEILPEYETLLD
jgi:putative hydrolase of HD superfamily